MVMAYGYYKLFYGIREQQYVPQFQFPLLSVHPSSAFVTTGEYNLHHELNKISDKPNAIQQSFIINRICFFSELAREKIWSRLHILPLLQAEEDRDQARRFFADKARERELLGQETKVYNTDKYVILQGTLYLDLGESILTVL